VETLSVRQWGRCQGERQCLPCCVISMADGKRIIFRHICSEFDRLSTRALVACNGHSSSYRFDDWTSSSVDIASLVMLHTNWV
jgi:hypothetical protein